RTFPFLAISALALAAAPAAAQVVKPGEPPLTAQTSSSGGPLDPVQKLVRFQSADLRIEVLPDSQSIRGLG
ncbi:hypothetical protein, partial [Klebsiella pneumoniae]|uniref:hypothetical protein n=1 Tax=Klebsiella pneumoniae TaxID=573 RepID=UPI0019539C51